MSTDDLPQPGPQPGTGDTPPDGGTTPRPPAGEGFFSSVRRMGLARSDDRWVGGVAGGVAERFGLDPLLVRGLLILSFFLTGAGLVIYAIAWALLPERRDGRIHLEQAIRGDFDVALLGAVIAFVVGIAWNNGLWSWSVGLFDWIGGLLWIAVWVGIIWLVVKLVRSRRSRPQPPAGPAGPAGPSGPGGYGGPGTPGAPTSPAAPAESGTPGGPTSAHFIPAPPAPYLTHQPSGESAPAAAPVPPPAPPAPAPAPAPQAPRPPRRGPGIGAVGIVVGLILVGGAVLLANDRVGDLGMPLWPTWLGGSIVVLGLSIVVAGLRGRKGGTLSFLAVLGVIAGVLTWPFAGAQDPWDTWDVWDDDASGSGSVVSNGTITPHSLEQAEEGYTVRFGSAVVDLTELDLDDVEAGDPVVVPISMAAGSTLVRIPDGEAVAADLEVIAGNATWRADGENLSVNTYTGGPARFSTEEVRGADTVRLQLDVDVRAGDLTIEEESR